MNLIVLCPSSKVLSVEPEQDSKQTPQGRQAHIKHDRGNVAVRDDPIGDEFREAIPPKVLIDSDGDKNRASDGLI